VRGTMWHHHGDARACHTVGGIDPMVRPIGHAACFGTFASSAVTATHL